MNCMTCKMDSETCDREKANNCNSQLGNGNTPAKKNPSFIRGAALAAIEEIHSNGFIYEKCKFCGSIIFRRIVKDSIASVASDTPGTSGVSGASGASDVSGASGASGVSVANDTSGAADPSGVSVTSGSTDVSVASDVSVAYDVTGASGVKHTYRREAVVSDSGAALFFREPSLHYDSAANAIYDDDERIRSAVAYNSRLSERGCDGICIQYDTGACDGDQCGSCEVSAADLCCKRYLLSHDNPNILEQDGGDYRNLMGGFFKHNKNDGECDKKIQQRLFNEALKANAYRDELRKHVISADDNNLIFEWREYSLDDILHIFPHIDRRPVRVEIQILIYLFNNYRYPIDLDHAEKRFQLPRLAINRYLRSYFGHSYSSLLARIRNEHSKELLRIPLLRIGEIGLLVGYKTHYHYSLNFKRYEGISPKEYRQTARSARSTQSVQSAQYIQSTQSVQSAQSAQPANYNASR